MTRFYLIRHAEAEGNLYRRAQGQYDSNITMLGRRQVAALAERFKTEHIDALWASDLIRTQSTASAILKYHPELTLHTDKALREVDVGCWEDHTWGEIGRDFAEQYYFFTHDPAKWHVTGSEDYAALLARLKGTLLGLAEAYPGKTVAAVSHAFAIRSLASDLSGTPFGEMPFGDNTAVTAIEAEGGALRLVSYGDGSHLGELSTFARQGLAADHRGKKADGTFAPLDPRAESELYTRAYRETWQASHGDLTGFVPALYLTEAARRAEEDARCLVKISYEDALAGLIELDPDRGEEEHAGWISLIWVEQAMRQRRFGAQLLGHAVSYFRHKGRDKLRLHVSQTNDDALRFYEAVGFRKTGTARGVGGPLYLMEMDIAPRVWRLP